MVQVTHGVSSNFFDVVGQTVAYVRGNLETLYHIPGEAVGLLGGELVGEDHVLRGGDELDFVVEDGRKSVGSVWTDESMMELFKGATAEDLDAWEAQGLRCLRLKDGTRFWTDTAVDEFVRGRTVESPYLTHDEAAAYLKITSDALYAHVDRRRIRPFKVGNQSRYTREMLDQFVKEDRR